MSETDPNHFTADVAASRDAAANVLTRRGIALLENGGRVELLEAIRCFDQAIELRRTLPLSEDPWIRYGLSAGWLNRGDTFTRLGSAQDLEEALRSFDEALVHIQQLPLDTHPLFRKRLAIAWLNRGLSLQAMKTENGLNAALTSFNRCIAICRDERLGDFPENRHLSAAAWTNRANALLDLAAPSALNALIAARCAIDLTDGAENDLALAEIGIKARHILCRALALMLLKQLPHERPADWIDEATDAVESGLQLARLWEAKGHTKFKALRDDLFRFGARVYQTFQPHFLTEFLLEQLESSDASQSSTDQSMRFAAFEAVWHAAAQLHRDGFKSQNTGEFQKLVAQMSELRVVEEKLAGLKTAGTGAH